MKHATHARCALAPTSAYAPAGPRSGPSGGVAYPPAAARGGHARVSGGMDVPLGEVDAELVQWVCSADASSLGKAAHALRYKMCTGVAPAPAPAPAPVPAPGWRSHEDFLGFVMRTAVTNPESAGTAFVPALGGEFMQQSVAITTNVDPTEMVIDVSLTEAQTDTPNSAVMQRTETFNCSQTQKAGPAKIDYSDRNKGISSERWQCTATMDPALSGVAERVYKFDDSRDDSSGPTFSEWEFKPCGRQC